MPLLLYKGATQQKFNSITAAGYKKNASKKKEAFVAITF